MGLPPSLQDAEAAAEVLMQHHTVLPPLPLAQLDLEGYRRALKAIGMMTKPGMGGPPQATSPTRSWQNPGARSMVEVPVEEVSAEIQPNRKTTITAQEARLPAFPSSLSLPPLPTVAQHPHRSQQARGFHAPSPSHAPSPPTST
jgi:hypothetical protein